MQPSFFDLDTRYAQLSKQGDPLERLNAVIDWALFEPILARIDDKPRKSLAGRKPTNRILMFKLLILQRLNNLADERLEFQVRDRLSFMRFLGLELGSTVPDARTVWAFREEIKAHNLIDPLFDRFNQALADLGVGLASGQIIDATFIPVPKQHNSREENKHIKQERSAPPEWSDPTKHSKHKAPHKDIDARWTKKNGQTHYGYKDHINIDGATKLITEWVVTDASVHDSQALEALLLTGEQGGATVHADSAYRSQEIEALLIDKQLTSRIHERAYKDKPLTPAQQEHNSEKSSIRVKVEHAFGRMENSNGGMLLRCIGQARVYVAVGLMNLTYNLTQLECLIRKGKLAIARLAAPKAVVMG